jgi:hypothetical protein
MNRCGTENPVLSRPESMCWAMSVWVPVPETNRANAAHRNGTLKRAGIPDFRSTKPQKRANSSSPATFHRWANRLIAHCLPRPGGLPRPPRPIPSERMD